MTIRLEFNRIAPGVEIGPHRHGVETLVYLAGGELVFEHGEHMDRRALVGPGDVLYEAPGELHRVRNEGRLDALVLLAVVESESASTRPSAALRRWHDETEPVRRGGGRRAGRRRGAAGRRRGSRYGGPSARAGSRWTGSSARSSSSPATSAP